LFSKYSFHKVISKVNNLQTFFEYLFLAMESAELYRAHSNGQQKPRGFSPTDQVNRTRFFFHLALFLNGAGLVFGVVVF
jgi:hypothetical protein